MRAVGWAMLAFGLSLAAGGRPGRDGRSCPSESDPCGLNDRLLTLELQMAHSLHKLTELGEFRNMAGSKLTLMTLQMQESQPNSTVEDLSTEVEFLRKVQGELRAELEDERELRQLLSQRLEELLEAGPRQENLTEQLSRLWEEKDGLKAQVEDGQTVLRNLEAQLGPLREELNQTDSLRTEMEDLRHRLQRLRFDVGDDRLRRVAETELGLKATEQRLKLLEYLLDDRGSNVSVTESESRSNRTLVDRLLRVEEDLRSVGESLSALQRTVSEGLSEVRERLSELRADLQPSTCGRNQPLRDSEDRNRSTEVSGANRNNSCDFRLVEVESAEEVREIGQKLQRLEEELVNSTQRSEMEQAELREKLDELQAVLMDPDNDWHGNATAVDLRLREVERISSDYSGQLARLKKMESALSQTVGWEDLARHDEKITRLFLNVSKLKGRTEDLDQKLDGWGAKIAEAKNWVAEHVDREHKKFEKQALRAGEDLGRKLERTLRERTEEMREELESALDRHLETVSEWFNRSDSCGGDPSPSASTNDSETSCAINLDWDSNLVVSYGSGPLTLPLKPVPEGDELVFRCSDVGRYVLLGAASLLCRNGRWSSDFPVCMKLADEQDIEDSWNVPKFCNFIGVGHHPFPLDCEKYYNCMENTFRIQSCPEELHFDRKSRSCVHRRMTNCQDGPAIDFHPLPGPPEVPVGIMPNGTLVVFPGQNLVLKCLRPEGEPVRWEVRTGDVIKTHPGTSSGDKISRLELKRVDRSDSGVYSCVKTGARAGNHSIHLRVEAVLCPEIKPRDPLRLDNETSRKLSSKLFFSCPDNHQLVGASFIVCLWDGRWSGPVPDCRPKGCRRPDTTDDSWLTLSPDLPFYPLESKVMLSCRPGAPALNIPAVVRCWRDDAWNLSPFPSCRK